MSNTDQINKLYSTKSIDSQSSYTGRYLKIFDEQAKNKIGSYNLLNDQKGQQFKSYTDRNDNSYKVIFEDDNESLKQDKSKQIFQDLEKMRNQYVKMMQIMEEKPLEISNKTPEVQNQFKRKATESYVPQFGSSINVNSFNLQKQQKKVKQPVNLNQINHSQFFAKQNIQDIISNKQISFEPRFTFAPSNPIDFSNHINQNYNNQEQIQKYTPQQNLDKNNSFFLNVNIQKQKQPIIITKKKEQQTNQLTSLCFPKIKQFKQEQIEFKQIQKVQQLNSNTVFIKKQLDQKNVIINEVINISIQPINKENKKQIFLQQQSNVQQSQHQPINQQTITTQQQVGNNAQKYQQKNVNSLQPNLRISNAIKFVKQVEEKINKYVNQKQQFNKIHPNNYLNKQNSEYSKSASPIYYENRYKQFRQPFTGKTILQNIEQVESIINPPSLPIYHNVNYYSNNHVQKLSEQPFKIRNDSPYKRIISEPNLVNLNINHNTPLLIQQRNNAQIFNKKRIQNLPLFTNNTPLTIKKQVIRPSSHDPRILIGKKMVSQHKFPTSKPLPIQFYRNSKAQHILQPNNLINNQQIKVNRPSSSHLIPSKIITYQSPRTNFSPLKVMNNASPLILQNSLRNVNNIKNTNNSNIQRLNINKGPVFNGLYFIPIRR